MPNFITVDNKLYIYTGYKKHVTSDLSDLVTGEDADAVSVQDIPEPDGAIRRPCYDIIGVWVEAGASDIG